MNEYNNIRVRERFDSDWLFYKGDISVTSSIGAGLVGGVTDCIDKKVDEVYLYLLY